MKQEEQVKLFVAEGMTQPKMGPWRSSQIFWGLILSDTGNKKACLFYRIVENIKFQKEYEYTLYILYSVKNHTGHYFFSKKINVFPLSFVQLTAGMLSPNILFFLLVLYKTLPTFSWEYGNQATHSSFLCCQAWSCDCILTQGTVINEGCKLQMIPVKGERCLLLLPVLFP